MVEHDAVTTQYSDFKPLPNPFYFSTPGEASPTEARDSKELETAAIRKPRR
jgi:hypothetical protein